MLLGYLRASASAYFFFFLVFLVVFLPHLPQLTSATSFPPDMLAERARLPARCSP